MFKWGKKMPKFEVINKEDAENKTRFAGKSGRIMSMYSFFIEQLKDGKAGHLRPSEGETVQAVRRRLGKAAKLAGKSLEIRRVHDEVYFWLDGTSPSKKPRRKSATGGPVASSE